MGEALCGKFEEEIVKKAPGGGPAVGGWAGSPLHLSVPDGPPAQPAGQPALHDLGAPPPPRAAYFLSTISEAPLLYMRKLSSGSLVTVLMDLRTELKVYTLYSFSSGIWLRTGS